MCVGGKPSVSVMASIQSPSELSSVSKPLLGEGEAIDGFVDCKGLAVSRIRSGGWKSASFIIVVEIGERCAYYGISSNLVSYLIGPLEQSTVSAAENVNAWEGTASLLPLLGGFVADSYLGRYNTIVFASILYIVGLGLLTLSAILPSTCEVSLSSRCFPHSFQMGLFFSSLYLIALAQGGHKPCVQAFGADQFDEKDSVECKAKSSFFNWWYFSLSSGTLLSLLILNYIQENFSWALGFGLPCVSMIFALIIFIFGTDTYRFHVKRDEKNPFTRIGRVFILAARNRCFGDGEATADKAPDDLVQFRFLNKVLVSSSSSDEQETVCTIKDVEDSKALFRLTPIWITSLVYAIVFAQSSTFFTKQGRTMDRSITASLYLPAASLQSFISISILVFVPIYDKVIVPSATRLTGKPSGITMLQRIGTGIFISVVSMVVSSMVEMKRRRTALEHGLVDAPETTVPMSVWWLVPQYVLFGVSDVFTMVGLQEFFYDQVPSDLRSTGLSLYLSIFGVGSLLSSALVSVVDMATYRQHNHGWFDDNINKAHLDYFYWLLACISAAGFLVFLYFSNRYVYNNRTGGSS